MRVMLFKGHSSRLELLIEKIQANKENQELGDPHIQDALGTEAGSSWGSEGQTSPPSSCATPNSATDVPEAELTFTLGATEKTPYACSFCDKAFPRQSYLKKHEQTHAEHMPFRCDYCSRLFKHKRSRDRHIKLHTGDKKYRCSLCDAAFSRSDHLKIHMRTHDNQKPFQCTVCNRGYNTAAALTSHMQNHKRVRDTPSPTPAPGTTFKCLQCSEVFRKPEDLQNHMVSQHNVVAGGTPPVAPTPRRPRLSPHSTVRTLSCGYCTKENFTSLESLQLHVQTMHGPFFSSERQQEMAQELPLFPLQASPSPSLLTPHHHPLLTPPSPSLLYSCELCTMRFHSVAALQKHALNIHRFQAKETGTFCCVQCNLQFSTPILFAQHYVVLHSKMGTLNRLSIDQIKPTDLSLSKKSSPRTTEDGPQCKKSRYAENGVSPSSNGVEMSRRTPTMNQHQYENPGTLFCNQCNAALPNFEAFRNHVKSHLDEAGGMRGLLGGGTESRKSPPVICPHCGVQLNSPGELPQHIISHFLSSSSEYTCQSCLKVFKQSDDLQKHLLEVHAHHLYRCALCKEMFDSKVTIQVHFAVKHNNESKLYRCTACPGLAVYHTEMDFSIHVRTMHSQPSSANPSVMQSAQLFRCFFCPMSFSNDVEMRIHLTVHTKQFHCQLCPESFHVEYLLDKHMQSHHSNQIRNGAEELEGSHSKLKGGSKSFTNHSPSHSNSSRTNGSICESSKKQDSANNNIVGTCEICERGDFASEAELAAHRKLVHHVKSSSGKLSLHCAYCNESCKSRSDLENHMKSHSQGCVTQGKHKCNICDEMCSSAVILAEHKLTHCKVINGTACTQCKASIINEDQFYQHLRQHSNTSPPDSGSPVNQLVLPTACVICRQTLVSDMEARIHARFHLNQSDTSQCSVCLHASDRRELIGGICKECYQRHGKVKPTHCSECQLKFETGSALEAHVATVHRKTYQCIKCQVSFESEKEIQLHVATHLMSEGNSGLECRLCLRVLGSPLQLQTHLIEHTFAGCPTFTCYICSAVFTAAQGLQAHMLEHGLAARPYDCPHCSQRFFFRAELDNHSFSHLEDDSGEDKGKVLPYYPYRTKMESINSSPMSTTSGMEMSSLDLKAKPTKTNNGEEYDSSTALQGQGRTQPTSSAEEDTQIAGEKGIKKEIKQETIEEAEEEEEQIDVGDHHSEKPVRSSEGSSSREVAHSATPDMVTDNSLRL